ncbi:MAG: hypothetical protein ACPGOV_02015 [Magnetovibrionaceae bacterium]
MDKKEELNLAYRFFFEDNELPHHDRARLETFIQGFLATLPADQADMLSKGLLAQFGQLMRTPEGQKVVQGFFEQARTAAFDAGHHHLFEAWDRSILDGLYGEDIKAINEEGKDGQKSVLFVASIPYFLILREALYLKERGYRVYLLCLSKVDDRTASAFEAVFERILHADLSKRLMKAIMTALEPDLCHVQCWMMSYFFGRMALETMAGKRTKVISEFYDITSLYAPRDDLVTKWDDRVVDLDLDCEKVILENSDAVISRFPPDVASEWLAENGVPDLEHLEFQAYPCREYFDHEPDKPSAKDGRIRLVYAGALIPPKGHPKTLFPEWGMVQAFEWILDQGMMIDVYSPPQFENEKIHELLIDFHRLIDRFPDSFRLLNGLPPGQLSQVLKPYDYGILLFNWEPGTDALRDLQKRGVMATKLFTYLEAGLPVLVNAEYTGMAGFAEGNGVGLGIASETLPNLKSHLEEQDYQALVDGVLSYRDRHSMEKEIARLSGLYDELLDSGKVATSDQ